jgi:hypothetical protein
MITEQQRANRRYFNRLLIPWLRSEGWRIAPEDPSPWDFLHDGVDLLIPLTEKADKKLSSKVLALCVDDVDGELHKSLKAEFGTEAEAGKDRSGKEVAPPPDLLDLAQPSDPFDPDTGKFFDPVSGKEISAEESGLFKAKASN